MSYTGRIYTQQVKLTFTVHLLLGELEEMTVKTRSQEPLKGPGESARLGVVIQGHPRESMVSLVKICLPRHPQGCQSKVPPLRAVQGLSSRPYVCHPVCHVSEIESMSMCQRLSIEIKPITADRGEGETRGESHQELSSRRVCPKTASLSYLCTIPALVCWVHAHSHIHR